MKKILIGILVLAVVAGAVYGLWGRNWIQTADAQVTPQAVQSPEPVKANSDVVAEAVVVPVQSVHLSLPTGGIVADVLVAEGDTVQSGQLLLRLDARRQAAALAQAEAQLHHAQSGLAELKAGPRPAEIEAAQAAVDAAQAQMARSEQGARAAEIAAAEAALAGAQASLQKVREGPREAELTAARADLANAEAALRQAQAAYNRVQGAADIAARPEALALEQATNARDAAQGRLKALQAGATTADVAVARAQIDQAQAQLDGVKATARPAEVAAAQAEIRRAQAQLDLLQAGARPETIAGAEADVAAAEAALEQVRVALADTELHAPMSGTVASLEAKAGEQVGAGSPLIVLADLSAWQIETDDLTELNVVRLHEGDPVTISFDAIPGLELPGKIVQIKAIGETKMGDVTYTVVIRPDRFDERLRWNMTATVVIVED
jgi:HlyD family secretion protein